MRLQLGRGTIRRGTVGGLLLAGIAVAAACGGSGGPPSPTTVPSATQAPPSPTALPIVVATPTSAQSRMLAEIEAHAAEVRELEPLAPVESRFLTRDAAQAYFRQYVDEEERARIDEAEPVYRLLGFISPEDDLMEMELGLAASQVIGFYDTEQERMFVVGDGPELDTMGVITISHEFVHVLQDQHFDLDAPRERTGRDWDAELALTALAEGDATMAMVDYMTRFIGLADLLEIDFGEIARLSGEMEDFPEALQQELSFPYEAGVGFAGTLLDAGGWPAVDSAFGAPPSTTEQILHPEKYLTGEGGREAVLPDLVPALGEGWQLQASNTLGEFLLGNHLDTQLTRAEAAAAAAGWGGDRWALYSDGAAGELLLLIVEWDAPEELDEFFLAYLDWLDARSGGEWERVGEDAALWQGPSESIYTSRQGGRATIIISTDSDALEQARRALNLP